MVDKFNRECCNGCGMCADICPQNAIKFCADKQTGFMYPSVDSEKCIKCGLCIKKCPHNNPIRRKVRPKAKIYAAWSLNDDIRMLCTSGGLFYELASYIINQGGVVAACSYTEDYRGAYHCIAENMEQLMPLCGSKHVQSNTIGIYSKVKELLDKEKTVMFVGTPCHVAALYSFLGKEYDNLLTADFICNSINSPKAQSKYIDYLEEIYGSKLIFSRSKDKRIGWTKFGSSAKFENGKEYYADRHEDTRVVGYHRGHLFIRESCLDCKYKVLPRNADITLGDFWGIEEDERNPKLEMGTSVVMANSDKGIDYMKRISEFIGCYEKTLDDVLKGNPALLKCAVTNGNGKKAFAALDNMRFDKVVNKYADKEGFIDKVYYKVKKIAKKMLKLQ